MGCAMRKLQIQSESQGSGGLICSGLIRGTTDQYEAAITIAAFDETRFVDLQEDARMA